MTRAAASARAAEATDRGRFRPRLLNIGYGNLVAVERVVAIVSPQSAPMRRLRETAPSGASWSTPPRAGAPARSS